MSGWLWWHRLTSPRDFTRVASFCIPGLMVAFVLCLSVGLVGGVAWAPADYQQGDGFRIIYVHVPSAFASMVLYAAISVAAFVSLVWRVKLANVLVDAAAPVGALFTLLALVTGSLWGKPMWGTWWIWDARLTSELLLLLIYGGVIALKGAFGSAKQGAVFKNAFVLIGSVNLPIIHFSVYWWNTLHQGSTLRVLGPSKMAPAMAKPLWIMLVAFMCYAALVVLIHMRTMVLSEHRRSRWVAQWLTHDE